MIFSSPLVPVCFFFPEDVVENMAVDGEFRLLFYETGNVFFADFQNFRFDEGTQRRRSDPICPISWSIARYLDSRVSRSDFMLA